MSLPCVVIVGRPNVGKSSLFNFLAGSRIAIEEETSGVTRDCLSAIITDRDRNRAFELIDTGGLGPENPDELVDLVDLQIELAIARADVILFLADARSGLSEFDREIARRLRRANKPIVFAVNKVDNEEYRAAAVEFLQLGFGEPVFLCATQKRGRSDLFGALAKYLPESAEPPAVPHMKLAIVGRRNVGKSTFVNALAGEERVIASEVPGTTRDAIDVQFDLDDKTFVAIDTAGLRKRRKLDGTLDFYGYARAQRSIRRADVVILMLDASRKIGELDKRIGHYVAEQHRPCIISVNKWDLAGDVRTGEFTEYLNSTMRVLQYAPIAYLSALTGTNVREIVRLAMDLFDQARRRVGTGELNRALRAALGERRPPTRRNVSPKIYYATQTSVAPPTLDVFVNDPRLFDRNYQRYLENQLRSALPFPEVPIRLFFHAHRGSRSEKQESG